MQTEITVEIHGLGSSGEGVGSLDGYVVFIDGALPGEVVKARFTQRGARHGRAELVSIEKASPDRVQPPCHLFGRCGGCQLMHLHYEAQLAAKRQRVVDALERIGKLDGSIVAPCLASPSSLQYRNKIQLPVREGKLGLYAKNSHDLVEVEHCHIHCSLGETILQTVRAHLPDSLRHVLIKSAVHTNQALVVFVSSQKPTPALQHIAQQLMAQNPAIRGVVHNLHSGPENVILGREYTVLAGTGFIYETLSGLTFKVSPASFFQVNPAQAENLYAKALEFAALSGQETVLDAYCGVGTLSLLFAQNAKEVVGVECVPEAIEDARENARCNKVTNVRFVCDEAERFVRKFPRADVVLLNPPRKGCEPTFLDGVGRSRPQRVVYISCDPATLARDLARLEGIGYRLRAVQPFDMFPQTAHVETVALLTVESLSGSFSYEK